MSLSQEQSSKHGGFAQREDTCVLPKFLVRMGPITAGAIFGAAQMYRRRDSEPESGRKLQSQSQIRCERGTETGEKVTGVVPR